MAPTCRSASQRCAALQEHRGTGLAPAARLQRTRLSAPACDSPAAAGARPARLTRAPQLACCFAAAGGAVHARQLPRAEPPLQPHRVWPGPAAADQGAQERRQQRGGNIGGQAHAKGGAGSGQHRRREQALPLLHRQGTHDVCTHSTCTLRCACKHACTRASCRRAHPPDHPPPACCCCALGACLLRLALLLRAWR